MARPQKNTVTYFPLDCEEGKKMFYIEETYGNDGFATFIKLLRELARSEYHYLNLSQPTTMMFLSAKCKVSKQTLESIINDLVDLGKFNAMLWNENKIIWCQDFVDSIQDAYLKRKNKCITFEGLLQLLDSLGVRKLNKLRNNTTINTQSKEEYIKEEEIKEDKSKETDIISVPEIQKKTRFNFKKKLLEYGFQENLVEDWILVRKNKKATNTETAFESFISEIEKRECNINEMLKICVENSWSGFKHVWVDNLNKNNLGNGSRNNNTQTTDSEHKQSAISAVSAMFGK